ncbi:hypothetical protein KIL84_012728, partial [Mauremys mutica]
DGNQSFHKDQKMNIITPLSDPIEMALSRRGAVFLRHVVALASNDGTVKTLELKSGQLSSLVGHEDEVQSVVFDHKAEHLLSGGSDGTLRLWS